MLKLLQFLQTFESGEWERGRERGKDREQMKGGREREGRIERR